MIQSEVKKIEGETVPVTAHPSRLQVNVPERDTFEVPTVPAPINRIPPEVLSVIPDYHPYSFGPSYFVDFMDKELMVLTHVCRRWRDTFTSRASLWTSLTIKNVYRTHTYIQRSQSSPLNLYLDDEIAGDAFALIIPHIHRLKSFTFRGTAPPLPSVLEHLPSHTPLLEKLKMILVFGKSDLNAFLNNDLSSLRELRLDGVVTHFPWNSLASLRVVTLNHCLSQDPVTRLLHFFESAPLLHTVELRGYTPGSSDPPPERIVPLRHLKYFRIFGELPHSTLLRHLQIPVGASLVSGMDFLDEELPLLEYLPEGCFAFGNLSHITAVNLLLDFESKHTRLSGPSGSLRVLVGMTDLRATSSYATDRQIFSSLGNQMLTIQRLTISGFGQMVSRVEDSLIYRPLSSAKSLRTLILIDCDSWPFTLVLDPENSPSNVVLCPNLEELVFHFDHWSLLDMEPLITMARNRASGGAKLSSVTLVGMVGGGPSEEQFDRLSKHVGQAVCRVDYTKIGWDCVPGEGIFQDTTL